MGKPRRRPHERGTAPVARVRDARAVTRPHEPERLPHPGSRPERSRDELLGSDIAGRVSPLSRATSTGVV
jgi:hypothetical protein